MEAAATAAEGARTPQQLIAGSSARVPGSSSREPGAKRAAGRGGADQRSAAGPSPISVFDAFASPGVDRDAGACTPGSSGGDGGRGGGIRSLRTHLVACHDQWPMAAYK
jgi:hypothetical protein